MPRPPKFRKIWFEPEVTYFKPAGVPTISLEEVILNKDELEAVRLADLEKLDQSNAAKRMGVSQPTFSRILESARTKIADVIVNGKALRVEGGRYRLMLGRRRRFRGGRV